MRLASVILVTRADRVVKLTNEEDWMLSIQIDDKEVGCFICPRAIRKTEQGCVDFYLKEITEAVRLEEFEVSYTREVLLAVIAHMM